MRALILIAGSGLALSACGGDQAAENTANVDAAVTAEDFASNDTTAIDAATGDDANMAADVDYTVNVLDNLDLNEDAVDGNADNSN